MLLAKRLSAIIVCVAMTVGALAQRTVSPNFSVGAKGGVSLGTIAFTPHVEQKMLNGPTFGVVARYTEEKCVGVMAEVNFTQRGWQEKYDAGEPFQYTRTLNYIDIPVLTHIFFGPKRFKVFINLGPEIAFMLGNSIKSNFNYNAPATVQGYPKNRETEQMSMDIKNKIDYGITAGLGFEWRITPRQSIMMEARYYFGLGNIYSATKKDTFSASRVTAIELTAGYMFRIK